MINPKAEKINAIKAVRLFTLDTFGTTAGLKIAKDFVDALIVQIDADQAAAFEKHVCESLRNGLTIAQMEDVLRKYSPKMW